MNSNQIAKVRKWLREDECYKHVEHGVVRGSFCMIDAAREFDRLYRIGRFTIYQAEEAIRMVSAIKIR